MKKHLVPSRSAKRAHYDADAIHPILDESLYCTVSYISEGLPFAIPTAFVRHEDKLYIHGSVGSHFIRELEKGLPVCISVTLMDALVIAKSAFSHSVNYRSVILFSKAEKIARYEEKVEALEWLTNKTVPESWSYLRPLTEKEVHKTAVLAFDISEASAKIRTGMPNDEPEDRSLPIWSGIIPLQTIRQAAIADDYSRSVPLPPHLSK